MSVTDYKIKSGIVIDDLSSFTNQVLSVGPSGKLIPSGVLVSNISADHSIYTLVTTTSSISSSLQSQATTNSTNISSLSGNVSTLQSQVVSLSARSIADIFRAEVASISAFQNSQIVALSGRPIPDIFRSEVQTVSSGLNNRITVLENNDSNVVHKTGNETISGSKVFVSDISGSSNLLLNGYTEYSVISAPTSPTSGKVRLYTDNDQGISRTRISDSGGNILTLNRDTVLIVKNTTGSVINKGQALYINGSDVSSNKPTVALAKADSQTTCNAVGVAYENIAINGFGRVINFGRLDNFNTSGLTAGAPIYLSDSVAGELTSTAPTLGTSCVVRMGVCIVSNASVGSIESRVLTPLSNISDTYTVTNETQFLSAVSALNSKGGGTIILAGQVTLTSNRTINLDSIIIRGGAADGNAIYLANGVGATQYTLTISGIGFYFDNVRFRGNNNGGSTTERGINLEAIGSGAGGVFSNCVFRNCVGTNATTNGFFGISATVANSYGWNIKFFNIDTTSDNNGSVDGLGFNLTTGISFLNFYAYTNARATANDGRSILRFFGTSPLNNNYSLISDGSYIISNSLSFTNGVSNIGAGYQADLITSQPEKVSFATGDYIMISDGANSGYIKKLNRSNMGFVDPSSLNSYALDSQTVHITSNETITGTKTFTSSIIVAPDTNTLSGSFQDLSVRTISTSSNFVTMTVAGGSNSISVPTNTAITFDARIVGKNVNTGVQEAAGFQLFGVIQNTNGTVALQGTTTQTVIARPNANWNCQAIANNTNKTLDVQVTGPVATTIKWSAKITLIQIGV